MNAKQYAMVLVTAPDLKTARRLAKAALRARLAACVNLIEKIESHYRWKNKMASSSEVLMLFKTRNWYLAALEKLLVAEHPYDVPEFVVVPLTYGNKCYLAWLAESVGDGGISARKQSAQSKRRRRKTSH